MNRANFIGWTANVRLSLFGRFVYDAFGETPYLVGSALTTKDYRDVDVRLILSDPDFERVVGPLTTPQQLNLRWVALSLAFSYFGQTLTGLPIDFQIQQQSDANAREKGARSAIGIEFAQWSERPLRYPGGFEAYEQASTRNITP